jgi:hypothetical protein
MGCSLGEIPDVAIVKNLFLIASKLVNSRDENRSVINNAPFSLCHVSFSSTKAQVEINLQRDANEAHE